MNGLPHRCWLCDPKTQADLCWLDAGLLVLLFIIAAMQAQPPVP